MSAITSCATLPAVNAQAVAAFPRFTHICGKSPKGSFYVERITTKQRMRKKLREVKEHLRRMMHAPVPEQRACLAPG